MKSLRRVRKFISIETEVEIDPWDMLKTLTRDELMQECERRGIELRPRKEQDFVHIRIDELGEVYDAFCRRNFEDALHRLEWCLPRKFRGFTDRLVRLFADGAS